MMMIRRRRQQQQQEAKQQVLYASTIIPLLVVLAAAACDVTSAFVGPASTRHSTTTTTRTNKIFVTTVEAPSAAAETATASSSSKAKAPTTAKQTSNNNNNNNNDMPPLAPLTVWGNEISDIRKLQNEIRKQKLPEFGLEISAIKDLGIASNDIDGQLQYIQQNAVELRTKWQNHGALIFRDFDLMKTQSGFQQFYTAMGMYVCLDPLHSVSARPTVDGSKNSPVYEAVNKESRKNFFIGMHNEFVGTRAPRAAAFVCFKAADKGGEFLIADGRRMFRDLDTNLLEELYHRQIRYSVMELPFFDWIDNQMIPNPLRKPIMNIVRSVVSAAINAKVDFDVELLWNEDGIYDETNKKILQARAPRQPPILIHPTTKDPTWFCNVHSHSSYLRKEREDIYGAERFEDGASRINKSDMFFGDDGTLTKQQLQELDRVTTHNIRYIKMTEGDVVLLDNYKTMHGRNVFDGTRKHAVAWFEGWENMNHDNDNNEISNQQTKQQQQTQTTQVDSNSNEKVPYFMSSV